jgi:anti-sigma B factor antagonist
MAKSVQLPSMIPDRRHEMDGEQVHVDFAVSQQTVADVPVLVVHGEVDVYSAPALKDHIASALGDSSAIAVVDLSQVEFMDSTGLGALVAARTAATEAGGRLPLVCDRDRILRLFQITGLDTVFEVHPTVAEAVSSLSPNSAAG